MASGWNAFVGLLFCLAERPGIVPARSGPRTDAEWLQALSHANRHLLVPALYLHLRQGNVLDAIPADARDYIAMLYRMNLRRNARLRRQARLIARALNAEGVVPILLKGGVSLFVRRGPERDGTWRMMRDLDFLIPVHQEALGRTILGRLGYRLLNEYPAGHHALGEFVRVGDLGAVDLHIELIDPWYILPARDAVLRAKVLPSGSTKIRALAPTDRILHHLLHAQVHHLGQYYLGVVRLDQLYEFTRLCQEFRDEIDWQFVESRTTEFALATPLQSYLLAARHFYGLPWPLNRGPSYRARIHFYRCLIQLRWPGLTRFAVPWGNLRGALAEHRMRWRYDRTRWLITNRLLHLWRFWRTRSSSQVVARLFRTE